MFLLEIFFIFILGLIFGSFTNVLVDRSEKRESLLGWSKCDYCGKKISWFENIPLISFIFLGGKCGKCKKKIPWQFFWVELLIGLLFVLIYFKKSANFGYVSFLAYNFNQFFQLAFFLFLGFIFAAIFLWDFKYMIIPDSLVFIGFSVSLTYYFFNFWFFKNCYFQLGNNCLAESFLGALVVGGFFYLLFYFSSGKFIGGGDIKLGFWLGFLVGLNMAYFLLLFAYILGAVISIFLILTKRKKWKSQIPFGPFLILSVFLILFFKEKISLDYFSQYLVF